MVPLDTDVVEEGVVVEDGSEGVLEADADTVDPVVERLTEEDEAEEVKEVVVSVVCVL